MGSFLSKLGTPAYQDAWTTLFHADARVLLQALPDGCVDLIFTDPPYGLNYNDGDLASRRETALGMGEAGPPRPIATDGPEEALGLFRWFCGEAKRVLAPNSGCCCCCCGGGPQPLFAKWSLLLDEFLSFKQAIVWEKSLGMGWHYRRSYEFVLVAEKGSARWFGGNDVSNIVRINQVRPQVWQHPTEKPEALSRFFILNHTLPGDLVLDPFCGSGSTLLAARAEGRHAIGIEIDGQWVEMARQRLSQRVLAFDEALPG